MADITNSHEGNSIKAATTAVELASLGVSTIKSVLDDKVKNRYRGDCVHAFMTALDPSDGKKISVRNPVMVCTDELQMRRLTSHMFVAELEEAEDDRVPRCPEAICKHALVRHAM